MSLKPRDKKFLYKYKDALNNNTNKDSRVIICIYSITYLHYLHNVVRQKIIV